MGALRRIGAGVVSAGLLMLLAAPQLASAQLTRSWVSSGGDDAASCLRTAPCKTFQGALGKTAVGGEINCVDSGDFTPSGAPTAALFITFSVTIDCKGAVGGLLIGTSEGIRIAAAGSHVVLRNLDIGPGPGGAGFGINIVDATHVHVEDVAIHGGYSGIILQPTTADSRLTLVRVTSQDHAQHGVWVKPVGSSLAKVSLIDSTLSGNTLTGILVNDNAAASITNSLVTSNGTHGIAARSTMLPARISLDRVTSSTNGTSGVLATGPAGVVYLSNVLLTGNAYGFYPTGGGASYVSYGNNRASGNSTLDGAPTSVVPQL